LKPLEEEEEEEEEEKSDKRTNERIGKTKIQL